MGRLEHLEIGEMIEARLKGHDSSKNVPWEKIKKKRGLENLLDIGGSVKITGREKPVGFKKVR